ncbi:hypothetical protein [Agrobacterium vitis]|uniref:hypothetical protein n=1 Tax=Agrobacterium vitis TaxID=373 RepID=UPI0012E76D09|nr:hypothetical protein [Agrobacterium vitis]MVA54238.1 hypothetical protein [Agrobacterium vitis]NSZ53751.1 hypothetical protein [Agrobacterium vitis]NTA32510.1 hypothetical protein [Agrobacterium vitis]
MKKQKADYPADFPEKTKQPDATVRVAATGYEATVMMRMIWNGKLQAGVSFAEVAEKEMRLAAIQRSIEPHELGRKALEIFRFADFAGWIIRG